MCIVILQPHHHTTEVNLVARLNDHCPKIPFLDDINATIDAKIIMISCWYFVADKLMIIMLDPSVKFASTVKKNDYIGKIETKDRDMGYIIGTYFPKSGKGS